MVSISNQNKLTPFIRYNEWRTYYHKIIDRISASETLQTKNMIDALVRGSILPIFTKGEEKFFLKGDLDDISSVLISNSKTDLRREFARVYCKNTDNLTHVCLNQHSIVALKEKGENVDSVYYSGFRNLISFCKDSSLSHGFVVEKIPYFHASTVKSLSNRVLDFVASQSQRADKVIQSKTGQFAHSAYYMGSKRKLGAFLVEAISRFLPPNGVVVDLMCGSGAASQAFSTIWPTYASDAQYFCRHLALIQGKSFTRRKANYAIKKILPLARKNVGELNEYFEEWIKKEDIFFHSNIDMKLFKEYEKFIEETSCYPTYETSLGAQLYKEVEKRKRDSTLIPYCLFSTYFANVYFGLRQSVEIDSLRYAIDQLDDSEIRNWAIGALIATLSSSGSTYAAHFAQPVEPTRKNLARLLDQRARSIIHEFTIRFTALARESEYAIHPIEIVPGPWQQTLSKAEGRLRGKKVLVYLDAPYKREEYSRYYHVLETAVTYNYPSATKKGKLPDKKNNERFKSAFFSRSQKKIEEEFVRIINNILERGWICAWSYYGNGDANIVNVANQVYRDIHCQIISFATPYKHKPQGKSKQKTVTEYCMLFVPAMK